jgi:hypothetical protein
MLKPKAHRRDISFLDHVTVVIFFRFFKIHFTNLPRPGVQEPDPRKMQINLTGFLNGKHARIFMGELWQMLDSAQKNESGIPQELLDLKVRLSAGLRIRIRRYRTYWIRIKSGH